MIRFLKLILTRKPAVAPAVMPVRKTVAVAPVKAPSKAPLKAPVAFKSVTAKPINKPIAVKPIVAAPKVIKHVAVKPAVPVVAPVVVKAEAPKPALKPAAEKVVAPAPAPVAPKTAIAEKHVAAKPAPVTKLTPYIYPYDLDSDAAKLLAKELDTKRVRVNGNYNPSPTHLVINYGNRRVPNWANAAKGTTILNGWDSISASSNKLTALTKFKEKGVKTVDFTTSKKTATEWVNNGYAVFCRTLLNGYSGHGIVVATKADEIVDAPLYSKQKKHIAEYRVIVVRGVVVDFMQKKRKSDWEGENGEQVNPLIKNHCNGWIFARQEVNPPECVLDEAKKATAALGLDFAAADVIFNQKEGQAYVLECNTAIGLQEGGTTLKRLAAAFSAICNNQAPKSVV